jgi:hypothetical protein
MPAFCLGGAGVEGLGDQPGDVGGGAQLLLAFARADLAFALSPLDRRVAPVSLIPAMKATGRGVTIPCGKATAPALAWW